MSDSARTEGFLTVALIALLTSYQLVRVIAFANVHGGIEHDSGWALGVARSVAERGTYTSMVSTMEDPTVLGGVNIHGDFAVQTHDGRTWFRVTSIGPSSTLLDALAIKIFGSGFWALRAGPLIFYTLFLICTAYALYRLAGIWAILLFHTFLFCYPHISIFLSYEALGEMPAMFFVIWAYLAFAIALQKQRPRWQYFLTAGVIVSLAIYAKLLALLSLGGMFIWAAALLLTDRKRLRLSEMLWLGIGIALVAVVWESFRLVILTYVSNFDMYLRQAQARINFFRDEGSGLGSNTHSGAKFFWHKLGMLESVAHPQPSVTALIFVAILLGGLVLLWIWRRHSYRQALLASIWLGWLVNTAWFVGKAETGWIRHYWFGLVLAIILLCTITVRLIRLGLGGKPESKMESQLAKYLALVTGSLLLVLIAWGSVSQPHVWSFFLPDDIVSHWREEKLNSKYTTLPWIIIPRAAQAKVVDYINSMPSEANIYYPAGNKAAELPPQTGRIHYPLNRRTHFSTTPHPADIVVVPSSMISPWRDPGIRQALLEIVEQACPNPVLKNDYYIICLADQVTLPQ